LQVVARGYRAVFETTAIGFEPSAGNFRGEFRRKRRIVNRSWRGVISVPEVLSLRQTGIFAWQVWSHKVLRWLVLPLVLVAAVGCFFASPFGVVYQVGAIGFVGSLLTAGIGVLVFERSGWLPRFAQGVFYFYLVNVAAILGVTTALVGRVDAVWTPERCDDGGSSMENKA
jgi:hypothetical protein